MCLVEILPCNAIDKKQWKHSNLRCSDKGQDLRIKIIKESSEGSRFFSSWVFREVRMSVGEKEEKNSLDNKIQSTRERIWGKLEVNELTDLRWRKWSIKGATLSNG